VLGVFSKKPSNRSRLALTRRIQQNDCDPDQHAPDLQLECQLDGSVFTFHVSKMTIGPGWASALCVDDFIEDMDSVQQSDLLCTTAVSSRPGGSSRPPHPGGGTAVAERPCGPSRRIGAGQGCDFQAVDQDLLCDPDHLSRYVRGPTVRAALVHLFVGRWTVYGLIPVFLTSSSECPWCPRISC
jgi:hypothetical protein